MPVSVWKFVVSKVAGIWIDFTKFEKCCQSGVSLEFPQSLLFVTFLNYNCLAARIMHR